MSGQETTRASGLHMTMLGMPVRVPLSGIIGVGIIAWLWLPSFGDDLRGVVAALVFAVLLYAGILLHELAHGLTARRLGNRVHGITLWILGGFTVYERERLTAGKEALIAASGPATTLALAGVSQVLVWTIGASLPPLAADVLTAFVWTNVLLGVLNLLPGLPLDGGGIVRALFWGLTGSEYRGTQVAAWSGRILAALIVFLPMMLALVPGSTIDFLTVVIAAVFGIFMWAGATASLRNARLEHRLPTITAGSLARRAVPVAASDSIALVMSRMADAQAGAAVITSPTGVPLGILNDDAVTAVPTERRAWVHASAAMNSVSSDSGVGAWVGGRDLIAALQSAGAPAVLVRDESGAIYGVLAVSDVEAALR